MHYGIHHQNTMTKPLSQESSSIKGQCNVYSKIEGLHRFSTGPDSCSFIWSRGWTLWTIKKHCVLAVVRNIWMYIEYVEKYQIISVLRTPNHHHLIQRIVTILLWMFLCILNIFLWSDKLILELKLTHFICIAVRFRLTYQIKLVNWEVLLLKSCFKPLLFFW